MKTPILILASVILLGSGPLRAEEAPAAGVPAWVAALTPLADLRVRDDTIDGEGLTLRHRLRIRARAGVQIALPADVDLVLGLASGNDGDPVSTNQTLSGAFSKKPLWLDLAYADWHPSWGPGLHVLVGRHKKPFLTPGGSELIWDSDLNFEGAAITWSRAFGAWEPFAAATLSWIEERAKTKDALLLGGQAGLKATMLGGTLWFTVGGSYFDYTRTKGETAYFDAADGFGNRVDATDPDALTYLHDYNLVEGFAEIGGKILGFPVAVFGDLVRNLDPSDEHTGWLAGVALGKAKEALSYEASYSYRVSQADSTLGAFSESDFRGGGTDGKGHKIGLGFVPVRHVKLVATYYLCDRGVDSGAAYHRAQVDLLFKL